MVNKDCKKAGVFALILGALSAAFVVLLIVAVNNGWMAKKIQYGGYGGIILLVLMLFSIPLLCVAALEEFRHAIALFEPREEQGYIPQSNKGLRMATWKPWTAFGVCVYYGIFWMAAFLQFVVGGVLFALAAAFATQYFTERKILV